MSGKQHSTPFLLMVLFLAIQGCSPGPRELQYGQEECSHCRMMLTEPEYASQIVMSRGRVYAFDSIECMIAYKTEHESPENIHSLWVPDFSGNGGWLNAQEAYFLRSDTLRSPMGLYLSAHANEEGADRLLEQYGGERMNWIQAGDYVWTEWGLNR
ncbi:MAG: nitrous oxide reductase accessory protein NosL [Balneolaceae bacterium]